MIPLEEALERMLAGVTPLPVEQVPLEAALGRVLAEPLVSRLTLPPWDNSAMDGYAVRAADVHGASRRSPRALRVVGESAAGHASEATVEPGTAVHILTGAPLPAGADAVVPVEATSADGGTIEIYEPTTVGRHIRRTGSDLRVGYPLLDAGQPLTPVALAVAAAGGHATLPVHRSPRVAVLATGDELVEPGAQLGPAQIPDSNSVGLLGQAREAGAQVRSLGIATDTLDDVLDRLRSALDWADVVVVSGGVSVGTHDVVKEALSTVGQLDLWRVAVQPGKPLAFARANDVLLFGLPGNPVSSFVTFELFVQPVLRRLAGFDDATGREIVRARLTDEVKKDPSRRAFLRVRLQANGRDGSWQASLAGGQGSHVLSALAAADGLAVVPEGYDGLPAGAEVDVIRLRTGGGR
jgi:molybdopterin molybdotransferase